MKQKFSFNPKINGKTKEKGFKEEKEVIEAKEASVSKITLL